MMFSPPSSSPFNTVADPRPADVPSIAGRALLSLPPLQWARLSSEDENPLSDLYEEPLKQWQVGFDKLGRCVLMFYDRTAYGGVGEWMLVVDGQVLHECPDVPQVAASVDFRRHFFSPLALRLLTLEFFESVKSHQWPQLVKTLAVRPEVLGTLKGMLLTMLESADETTAESGRHALVRNIELIAIFKRLITAGMVMSALEKQRLKRGIENMMMDGAGLHLLPLRSQLMDGVWWLRLQQEEAVS